MTSSSSDSHNGRSTDKYDWSQTINELEVRIPIPKNIRSAKQVRVDIRTNHFTIHFKDPAGEVDPEPFLTGLFTHPIRSEDGIWNLHPGDAIRLFLEKVQDRWWDALLQGENPIDLKAIDPTIPLENLREDEQMKIAELMHDQEQKRKGLPTSEESKMEEVLRKAWDAPGSPFKGQPFDPTIVQGIGKGNIPNLQESLPKTD